MDRYVIRERRLGVEYPEGNHMIAFSATSTGNNITMPEQVFYRPGNTDSPSINMHLGAPGLVALQAPSYPSNVNQPQGHFVSGIDPRYLAAYNDNSAGYIATEISKKQTEIDLSKNEVKHQVKTRSEKLKELQKSGIRVFSGPIENILKWHKSLQDVGLMVLYETVGKCVSVRAGESCAKNLVVRDDNGPAIQVVYYEIDFLLPELKIPCLIRVIGRIMPGSSRLQAFSVRPATGDDISILPRRAAVASHHVAKLCKEYSQ
ncbi:uncharacterized protein LOC123656151 [Melitaea cinxia]|uniref:uncharacterized protein LOC123656151 n=1 Tax=Melitaea cinxia TaxID=113334 RepID=UPI001E273AF0|nr:uncharacterized protein LOC123656151 [Melitaea cinxia]